MKKIRLTTILLLSFMLVLGMSQAAFAQSKTVDGGTYEYDGDTITDSAGQSIDKAISNLEPGDDVTLNFSYTNDSEDTTYWYLENTIVKTLEDSSSASDGGYSYKLSDGDNVIFDSEAVGGKNAPSGENAKGLKAATDATDDWFFIRELGAGESGQTTLYVALDGESQINSYMDTNGQLQVNYAVEKQPPGEDTIVPGKGTKTGDSFNPLFALLAMTAAMLVMLLAILSYFRDRKDGEDA